MFYPLVFVLPMQVQCHTLTGYCWCVTVDGKPVSGSSVHNRTPVCSGTWTTFVFVCQTSFKFRPSWFLFQKRQWRLHLWHLEEFLRSGPVNVQPHEDAGANRNRLHSSVSVIRQRKALRTDHLNAQQTSGGA